MIPSGAPAASLSDLLAPLQGKPLSAAVEALGYPEGRLEVGEEMVYVWDTQRTETYSHPTPAPNYPGDNVSTRQQSYSRSYGCTVRIGAGKDGRIVRINVAGDPDGCRDYKRSAREALARSPSPPAS